MNSLWRGFVKNRARLAMLLVSLSMLSSWGYADDAERVSLTVKVEGLRNSKGVVVFALYNKDGSIPDEHYKKCFRLQKEGVVEGTAHTTFVDLPKGKYAVSVLHDENKNGKIDKRFILPTEGVGFSNFRSISLGNRPNFSKASFSVFGDGRVTVRIVYF
jgi:uncharacterized protein (DUF2141 family)